MFTHTEEEALAALAETLRALRTSIADADDGQTWHRVWESMIAVRGCQAKVQCNNCRADVAKCVLQSLTVLEDAWHDVGTWGSAKARVDEMLQLRLEAPKGTTDVRIECIKYTQAWASDTFRHGVHAHQRVDDIAEQLVNGQTKPTDENMILDVVYWHGDYWSLNNRHLHALKLYLRQVHPEWKREEEVARVRLWPLAPNLRLPYSSYTVFGKFGDALSTCNHGRSISL